MLESVITLLFATALLLGSPGPVPLALAAIGATYGVRGGLPFLSGILIGLCLVMVFAMAGITALLSTWPGLKWTMQLVGSLYIGYVAFKIASAPR